MDLNAQILLQIVSAETSSSDLSTTVRTTNVSRSVTFTTGTGASQAQLTWSDSRTVAADGDDTIALDSLGDDRGSVSMTAIKSIYIRNTGAAEIIWAGGGWGASPFEDITTGRLKIGAGSTVLITNPSATGWVADGDPGTQTVVIENGSAAVDATYDVILIGEGTIT